MGRVRERKETGFLFFDFVYQGYRCREYTKLKKTQRNIHTMEKVMSRIDAEITLGTFDYAKYFPNSKMLEKIEADKKELERKSEDGSGAPLFEDFAEEWLFENQVRWKQSYIENINVILNNYLLKEFGNKKVSHITKVKSLNSVRPSPKFVTERGFHPTG